MIREKIKRIPIISITITGGSSVNHDEGKRDFRVPKRDLVGVLQVLFQNQRLKYSKASPYAETFIHELLNFKVKININANESFEAAREGDHDDLVLSAAIACWYGEQHPPFQVFVPEPTYSEARRLATQYSTPIDISKF